MTKQFRGNQGRRDSSTVNGNEGLARPLRALVDGTGDELLSSARLALDQYGRLGGRHLFDVAQQLSQSSALTDDLIEIVFGFYFFLQIDIFGFQLLRHSFSEVAGMPVIGLTDTPLEGFQRVLKTLEDYVLGGAAVLLASPLLCAIAAGIKLTSRGPILYRQERVTWNGRRFTMVKFRSMPIDSESHSGPVWSRQSDPRATWFGALLRRYSLDELPQLFNVLHGDMSLVGPRPERPEFVAQFRQEIPGYMQKHMVKAGITGWAQVNDLRGSSDLSKRIQYDLYYIDNWSVWFDLRILALTVWHVFRSRNAY